MPGKKPLLDQMEEVLARESSEMAEALNYLYATAKYWSERHKLACSTCPASRDCPHVGDPYNQNSVAMEDCLGAK